MDTGIRHPKSVFFLLSIALCVFICAPAYSDVVYFKDGRKWEGLILQQNDRSVRMDLGFDVANLERKKIKKIIRSNADQLKALRASLKKKRQHGLIQKEKGEFLPKVVRLQEIGGHLFVDALINGSVSARLLIDTGASVIVLPKEVGQRLGIRITRQNQVVHLKAADGRKIKAAVVTLKSVRVQNAEARNVYAAILLDPPKNLAMQDGLLGMSYLRNFNFKIDTHANKMTLEKLKAPVAKAPVKKTK